VQQRALDQPRALEVRAPARQRRLRVLAPSDRVRQPEEVQCLRRRPLRRLPLSTVQARADSQTRRQAARATVAEPSIRQSPGRAVEHLRAAKTYRAGARPHSRLHLLRQPCRQSAASRWQVLGSRHKQLSGALHRHRLIRTTGERQLDRFHRLLRQRPLERAVTVWQAVPSKEPLHRTHPAQTVRVWCRMLHRLAAPVLRIRNRHQRRKERAAWRVRPIK
jgi:hypothetical protein